MAREGGPAGSVKEDFIGRDEVRFGLGVEDFVPHAGFEGLEATGAPPGEDHAADGGVFGFIARVEGGDVVLEEFVELLLGFAGQ